MVCRVCKEDKNALCSCGFCTDCLNKYGHGQCNEIADEKNNEA